MEPTQQLDIRIQENLDNLNSFTENINCLYETFEFSEITLRMQRQRAHSEFDSFCIQYKQEEDGQETIQLPRDKVREFLKLHKKKERAESAFNLIPRSYVVSLISLFDAFIGNIIKNIYNICPEKLNNSEQKLSFSELSHFNTLADAKDYIIDNKIEAILRSSHQEQFDWLAKELSISTLTKFKDWPNFIEITQRRNLFVHTNGIVSNQYLTTCNKYKVDNIENINKGDKLNVDRAYFERTYEIFYEIGIKLSQMVLRCLLLKKEPNLLGQIDSCLMTNIFDLITDKKYDIAIALSEFALSSNFKHKQVDRIYFLLNMAQSYKWKGENEKCLKLLKEEDSSAWSNELKVPKLVLEDNYEQAYLLMRSMGDNNEVLNKTTYRTWPIFQKIREEKQFKEVFKEIFQEELIPQSAISSTEIKSEEITS